MTDPTRRVAATSCSPSAQTSKSTPNTQRTSSFRDALDEANRKRARPNERKKPTEKEGRPSARDPSTSPLLAQSDGTLVVANPALAGASGLAGLLGAQTQSAVAGRGARSTRSATDAAQDATLEARSLAVEQVRVGRAGDTVRVHATLGEGAHKGVELRAVERNGKIEVELVAQDSVGAERLRSEMTGLRDTLDASGNDRVAVSVVDASASSRESRERPRDQQGHGEHGAQGEQGDRGARGDRRDLRASRGSRHSGVDDASGGGVSETTDAGDEGENQRWRLL